MTAPRSSKTMAAAKAEALDTATVVEYGGRTYRVPPSAKWPARVLENVEDGKVMAALKALIGAEDYDAFMATEPLAEDVNEFYVALGKASGTGNS